MKGTTHTIGFILLSVGTIGLLLNEMVVDLGRGGTLTFAALNVLGLIALVAAGLRHNSD